MQLRKQGHMITLQSQHTQGERPMKEAARTPRRLLMGAGLVACMVPMSIGTAAQSELGWPAADTVASTAPEAAPQEPRPEHPVRVHVLAKELGIASKEVIQHCNASEEIGVELKNHMSMIPPDDVVKVRQDLQPQQDAPPPPQPPAAEQPNGGAWYTEAQAMRMQQGEGT